MLLIVSTISACSHHSCLLHLFLPSPFDLVVLICSTCSCLQHCFTYNCAFTCCFTNSDNSHKHLLFHLLFHLLIFVLCFFLSLHFYLVFIPPAPQLIHLYASVGAWSSKLMIFNNIQTWANNFNLFLHCLCVCVCVFFFLLFVAFAFYLNVCLLMCWCI
jgi:hypothetical protein